jgi:hypothetical protein
MFPSTAINLLSEIPTLKFLSLGIVGDTPILPVLATLFDLQELELHFRDSVAIGHSEWKPLGRLEDLRSKTISSWDDFGFSQVDSSSITTNEFVSFFQALPRPSTLWINAAISNTAQLYIQAGEICKSIKALGVRGQFIARCFSSLTQITILCAHCWSRFGYINSSSLRIDIHGRYYNIDCSTNRQY